MPAPHPDPITTVEVVTRYGGHRHRARGINPNDLGRHFTVCLGTSAWTLASWAHVVDHPHGLTTYMMAELPECPRCAAALAAERPGPDPVAVLRDAVLAIHRPVGGGPDPKAPSGRWNPYCHGCWEAGGMDGAPSWPCPTAIAVGVDDPEAEISAAGPLPDGFRTSTERCPETPCAEPAGHPGPHVVELSFDPAWKATPPALEPDDRD